MGLDGSFQVEANGFLGGIWCLWGTTSIFISMVFSSTYHVHLHINPRSLNLWVFTTIYASPQLGNLVILWDELCNIDNDGSNPWIVVGDVNQVLYQSEKHGGGFLNLSSATLLVDCLNDCNISELGFSSSPFTKKRGALYKCLDRVVANVVAVEIPQFQSGLFSVPSFDHCWLWLHINDGVYRSHHNYFKFLGP